MISVTMLSAYLYCKRKLFLEKVLKIVEPEKEVLVLGKIRHEVFDVINKDEERIVKSIDKKLSKDEIIDLYKKNHSKALRNIIVKRKKDLSLFKIEMIEVFKDTWESVEPELNFRAEIVHEFMKTHNLVGAQLWEKLTPKIKSEIYIASETLQLKGIIDKLEVFDDKVIPIELKTGKAPKEGVWPGHMIQVAAYMLLLQESGKVVPNGIVYYLKEKEKKEVFLNPFLKDEIIELAKKVNALLEEKQVPDFCTSKPKCDMCGLKAQCYSENYLNEKLKELSH